MLTTPPKLPHTANNVKRKMTPPPKNKPQGDKLEEKLDVGPHICIYDLHFPLSRGGTAHMSTDGVASNLALNRAQSGIKVSLKGTATLELR